MVFSRDPHFAAVGFVWNPLPSLLATPFLFLKPWFPALLSSGFAGNLVAAICGAAGAGVLLSLLRDLDIRPLLRWILLAAYAAHPLVIYAGSNGMSEAPYLLFLLLACRSLLRWLESEAASDLAACGVALAIGYLARYEVIVAAAGVSGLVVLTRAARTEGPWRIRLREALADLGIVAAPVAFAFVSWAAVSWVIVGSPFEQFTSEYGNSAQLAVLGDSLGTPESGGPALWYTLGQLTLISLAWPVAIVLPWVVAFRRRSLAVTAPWAVFGSILLFEVLAFLGGATAGWLRYYIVAVPFVVILAATMVVDMPFNAIRRRWAETRFRAVAALLLVTVGILSSATMVTNNRLAREEAAQLGAVVDWEAASPGSRQALQRLGPPRQIARYLDSLRLGQGAVLVDMALGFEIVIQSRYPKNFVVTSDRDFDQSLADPATFGIRYLLVPPPERQGRLDAVNRTYPSLYQDGAGLATLAKEFETLSDWPRWRLYEVTQPRPL